MVVALLALALGIRAGTTIREPRSAWRPRAPLPTPRAQARAVALNGKIYVLGGCPGTPSVMAPQLGLVEIYDPTTDSWVGSAPMPVLHGSGGAVALGGRLYVIDGADGAVYEFDPGTTKWTRKSARMPTVRTIFASAVARGKIYTIGGLAGDLLRGYRNSNAVEIYDPATDTWKSAPPILVPRHALAAATWNETIFIIGGDADSPSGGPNIRTNLVEAYDLASNTWSRRAASPMALHYHPVALAAGRIYAFEGDLAAVLAYDPARDSWTRVSSKPHVRWADTAAEASGRIYLFGGWDNPNFDTVLRYTEEYDAAADSASQSAAALAIRKAARRYAQFDPKMYREFAGRYVVNSPAAMAGMTVIVTAGANCLRAELSDGNVRELIPESSSRFSVWEPDHRGSFITFLRGQAGKVTGFVADTRDGGISATLAK